MKKSKTHRRKKDCDINNKYYNKSKEEDGQVCPSDLVKESVVIC